MFASLLFLPLVSALAVQRVVHHDSLHARLPAESWFHESDHPVHKLFRRGGDDGTAYTQVGTRAWSSAFPSGTPDSSKLPSAWVDALNTAVAAGRIPNTPQSHNTPGTNPVYPSGNPNGPEICSATYKCRIPGDIWDAPDGHFALSFDDGPQPATPTLLKFLQENNEIATHFMIGVNIIYYPNQFLEAFEKGDDIAVHTWTHPYMTTLSNLDVVAQLGWTLELIHNSTGGRVAKFWRPPYGDSDTRVRAIAKEVFGLTTVLWNQDTEDWSLTSGGTTAQAINASMTKWLTGPKKPGVQALEHELSDQSVAAFIAAYPVVKANGWQTISSARMVDGKPYSNADSSDSTTVTPADIVASNSTTSGTSTTTSQTSTTAPQAQTSDPTSRPSSAMSWRTTEIGQTLAMFFVMFFMFA